MISSQAMVFASRSIDHSLNNVLEATRGIFFFGTPHGGDSRASWTETISVMQKAILTRPGRLGNRLDATLRSLDDEDLLKVSRLFRQVLGFDVQILSFYETEYTVTERGKILVISESV